MGLFSTKKVHSVNTTITRLIEDKNVRPTIPGSVIGSIIRNDDQIIENVLEDLISGVGIRAHRMYDYGGNGYTYGRPSAQIMSSIQGQADAEALLKSQVGATLSIVYSKYAPLNTLHKGWVELVGTYGYKSSTNVLDVLSISKGASVYLKDMRAVLTTATVADMSEDGMAHWSTPPNAGYTPTRPVTSLQNQILANQMLVDTAAVTDSLLVTYQWQIDGELFEDSFNISIDSVDDADYYQIKYSYDGNDGYWTYRSGEGTHLNLDELYAPEAEPFGSFFPFAYFRYNNTSMGADITSVGYKSSKKLVKYLGIDYADLLESINENPDIGDVEQAMLIMAVPANTTNQQEQRYLFDFFDRMQLNGENPGVSSIWSQDYSSRMQRMAVVTKYSYAIQDSRFKMTLGASAVYKRNRGGVVATVGEYASQYIVRDAAKTYINWEHNNDDGAAPILVTELVPVPVYYYRYQDSPATYIEIEVVALNTKYHVWGDLTTVGDETNPLLLVPLDYSITSDYNIPDREELYARSLHLVFNSHIITKIKWYQTSIFKLIMFIIAIVIAYFTGYFDPFLLAAAEGGIALAVAVITAIVEYIVVSYLIKLFIKAVGVKASFLVAIIAVIAAAYGVYDAGSLAGAPWAQQLLAISTNLTAGIGDAIQQSMVELGKESIAFGLFVEKELELLEKAKSLLEQSTMLSPFVIFGESPDDFYNRTVHSGNIGVSSIDAISYYVDTALTLPELVDTIGNT